MKRYLVLAIVALQLGCSHTPSSLYSASDFTINNAFTSGVEGPAVNQYGNLFAVNAMKQGTVGIVSVDGSVDVFAHLPAGSIGNGIRFDKLGNMYIADYAQHNVLMIAAKHFMPDRIGPVEVDIFAHNSDMNQPNDLAIMDNGILFASDPNWQAGTGQLWKISATGETFLLESNMGTTNGVEVSPDNKHLYVNESVQRTVWRYDIDEKGNIANKRPFFSFADHGLDGMRTDIEGNLYIARYGAGTIAVLSPKGELLREIPLNGRFPTNVAFGDPDGKTLFVTMQKKGAIEKVRVDISGRAPISLLK